MSAHIAALRTWHKSGDLGVGHTKQEQLLFGKQIYLAAWLIVAVVAGQADFPSRSTGGGRRKGTRTNIGFLYFHCHCGCQDDVVRLLRLPLPPAGLALSLSSSLFLSLALSADSLFDIKCMFWLQPRLNLPAV